MEKLNAGVIGLGVGEQHIIGYDTHPKSKVTMVCDFSKKKIEEYQKKHIDLKITDNADDILENDEIDVVSIASYDNYHYEQITKALKNGKHVFVEKPLCLYEEEAKEIRKFLNSHKNLRLSSNLIMRRYPRFQYVKKIIEDGGLGDIFYVEGDYNYGRIHRIVDGWRGSLAFYSVIYGGAVHLVDLLMWLTGKSVDEVFTYGNNFITANTDFNYNDFAVSLLKFDDDSVGKISSNFGCVFPHFHAVSIYGDKATFVNDFDYGKLYKSRNPSDSFEKINAQYKSNNKGELVYDFVDSIFSNSTPMVSTDDVFKTMSVCFAMEKSMKTGEPEKVNYI